MGPQVVDALKRGSCPKTMIQEALLHQLIAIFAAGFALLASSGLNLLLAKKSYAIRLGLGGLTAMTCASFAAVYVPVAQAAVAASASFLAFALIYSLTANRPSSLMASCLRIARDRQCKHSFLPLAVSRDGGRCRSSDRGG